MDAAPILNRANSGNPREDRERMKRFQRVGLSVAVALGILAMVPGAVFAAAPACGDTLYVNTTLTADLDCSGYAGTALYMGKKSITLNLNGYTIWGWTGNDSYYGVDTNYKKWTTIKNGTIANFGFDVYLNQSVGGKVKNLTLTGDPADSDDYGIYVDYGTTNKIDNNDINGFNEGMYVEYSAENWITNNNVTGDAVNGYPDDGFYLYYETGDHLIGNTASDYTDTGFEDSYSGHQTYQGNSADGSDSTDTYGYYLYCDEYGWVHATNNTATNNGEYGFYVYYCYDYYSPYEGERTIMQGNKALDNGDDAYGFYDEYSINALWDGNVAKRSGSSGFYLDYPGYVTFRNNVANRNGANGIDVEDNYSSIYNFTSFANNTANRNGDYGIYGGYGISGASGNTAHNNVPAPDECYNVDCN
jgi:parallel beta-helix repeat protein